MSKRALALGGAAGATFAAAVVALVLLLTQPVSPRQVPVSVLGVSPAAAPGAAAVSPSSSTVSVPAFGANPSGLSMDIYVPKRVRPHPAILVALHECQSNGRQFFEGTDFATLADKYGFLVIYPTNNSADGCWDVLSKAALRRGGGSDPVSIMSMITFTERTYHADPHRVYVTGASYGGVMTGIMLADYPDVFAAGAIFMGYPFACGGKCSFAPVTLTAARWGGLVRKADPGYHGPRPKVQIWHGTEDDVLVYDNLGEQVSQWTNVLGVSQAPVITDHPAPGWTRTAYGTSPDGIKVEAFSIRGVGHDLPEPLSGMEWYAVHFFGLDR